MINLVLATALVVSAFLLVATLSECEDKKERHVNIGLILWDLFAAVYNLVMYINNRGG